MHTHARLAVALALATTAGVLGGCGSSIKIDPDYGSKRPAEEAYPSGQSAKRHGPPAHAAAVGLRRKYQYVYYPACQVYYAPDRDQYAWLEGADWRVGVNLPDRILIKLVDPVQVELDDREPWVHQHYTLVAQYPQDFKGKNGKAHGHAKKMHAQDQQAFVSD